MAIFGVAGGLGAGFFLAKQWTWSGLIAISCTLLLLFVGSKFMDKAVSRLGKERLKYWRGGQVEEYVDWLLEDLPADWHIFNGLMLKDGGDIDHVLIGPGGVFVVSTKAQRGIFTLADDNRRIFCNLKPTRFINDVWEQSKLVKARLEAFLVNDVPWVTPVLAVPFAWVECDSIRKDVWILHQENLTETFRSCTPVLSKAEITTLARLFDKLLTEGREFYKQPKKKAVKFVDRSPPQRG